MLPRRDRLGCSGEYPTGSETHGKLHPHEPLPSWRTEVQAIRSSRGKELIVNQEKSSEKF